MSCDWDNEELAWWATNRITALEKEADDVKEQLRRLRDRLATNPALTHAETRESMEALAHV